MRARSLLLSCAWLLGLSVGCRSALNLECTAGEEACECTPMATCEDGLECANGICVPASADDTAADSTSGETAGSDSSSETASSGDGDAGDGDADAGDGDAGDGDGDAGDGDAGDGDAGDGDGDAGDGDAGDGDGDSGDGDSGDGDGDGGTGFGDPCDPYNQDCADGKCTAVVEDAPGCCVDANQCAPIIGNAGIGEACTREAGNDNCAEGLFCQPSDTTSGGNGAGTCKRFCQGHGGGGCDQGEICIGHNGGALNLCESSCNALLQDCPDEEACFAAQEFQVCMSPTAATGLGEEGDSCTESANCQPGHFCMEGQWIPGCDQEYCCIQICDLSAPECGQNVTCEPYYGDPPAGSENVGYCAI